MDVHRVRFIEHDPQPIHCLAFSDESSKSPQLALSRGDGSIEIWRTDNGENFYKDIWVPGGTDGSVEALAWCSGRLFTSGLTGIVVEWDLAHLRPFQSQDSFGGAVWCMQPDRMGKLLAVGCEDGKIRLFDVTFNSLSFTRGLDRQGGRVLSLAWHPDGGSIVAGGADGIIKKLDVKSGQCVLRITLEEQQSCSTLVWDLRVLSDSTIVSADSLGKVQLWNSSHGTLVQSHHLHTADVLTLAVSEDESKIYSSGIDQKVICLQRVENKRKKWLKSGQIRVHSHDVRAIALSNGGILASAGIDTQLVTCSTSSFENNSCHKYHPCPDSSRFFSVARAANVLVHQGSMALKFWQLSACPKLKSKAVPTAAASTSVPNGNRELKAGSFDYSGIAESPAISLPHCTNGVPTNFLEIKCSGPSHILSSAVSPDAVHVALSTVDNLWLYQVDHEKLSIKCTKQTPLPSFKMAFSPNGQLLVLATIHKGVKCVDTLTLDFDNARTVQTSTKTKRLVVDFDTSPDSKLIVVLSYNKRLAVLDLQSGTVLCKVPKMESAPMLFKFRPSCVELVLFSGTLQQLYTFNIAENHLSIVGSVGLTKKSEGRSKLSCPNGLVTLPNRDMFVVYDNDCVAIMRAAVQTESSHGEKSVSRKRKRCSTEGGSLRYQFIAAQPLVLYVSPLGEGELVIAELSWTKVLDKLPPALVRDQYGT